MARGDTLPPHDPGDGEVGRPVDRPLDGAEDLRQGATGRLVPARAGEPFGGRIQGGDPPSGVGRDHGVTDAGQGDAVPFPLGLLGFEPPPGLGGAGPGSAAGVPHGPAEQGDDQPGGEEGEDDLGPIREDRPWATGLQEEVIGRQPGEGDGQERGSEAAVPGGDADGDDEGEEGEPIAQEGVEGESDGRRQGDRDRCDAIAQGGSQGGIGHLIAVREVPVGLDGLGTDLRRGGPHPLYERCHGPHRWLTADQPSPGLHPAARAARANTGTLWLPGGVPGWRPFEDHGKAALIDAGPSHEVVTSIK